MMLYFDNKISDERAIELMHVYTGALSETVVPVYGARDILQYLYSKYTVLVATNGPNGTAHTKLEKIGAADYATEVLTADVFGY